MLTNLPSCPVKTQYPRLGNIQPTHDNFGDQPQGDITEIAALDILNHDILMAGFPRQPFSICCNLKGFEDTRGTVFFEIARNLKAKPPRSKRR